MIDTEVLDATLRRFPSLLSRAALYGPDERLIDERWLSAIRLEYRLVRIERGLA